MEQYYLISDINGRCNGKQVTTGINIFKKSTGSKRNGSKRNGSKRNGTVPRGFKLARKQDVLKQCMGKLTSNIWLVEFPTDRKCHILKNRSCNKFWCDKIFLYKKFPISSVDTYTQLGLPCPTIKWAIERGFEDMVNLLIDKKVGMGEQIDASILTLACSHGRINVVKNLISRQLVSVPVDDISALNAAVEKELVDVVIHLGKNGYIRKHQLHILLKSAAVTGNVNIARILFLYGGHDVDLNDAFEAAIMHGHQSMVNLLYISDADIYDNDCHSNAIKIAKENGHMDVVKFMYGMLKDAQSFFLFTDDNGCNNGIKCVAGMNIFNGMFSSFCDDGFVIFDTIHLSNGNHKTVWRATVPVEDPSLRMFNTKESKSGEPVKYHSNMVNLEGPYSIYDAQTYKILNICMPKYAAVLAEGNDDMAIFVLQNSDIRSTTNVLSLAVEHGRMNIVQYLVEDVKHDIDEMEGMPLKKALIHGHLEIYRYLLDKGAKIDHPSSASKLFFWQKYDSEGNRNPTYTAQYQPDETKSLLVVAANSGQVDVVQDLVNRGLQLYEEQDAVSVAIANADTKMLDILLSAIPSFFSENKYHKMALQKASEKGNDEFVLSTLEKIMDSL